MAEKNHCRPENQSCSSTGSSEDEDDRRHMVAVEEYEKTEGAKKEAQVKRYGDGIRRVE